MVPTHRRNRRQAALLWAATGWTLGALIITLGAAVAAAFALAAILSWFAFLLPRPDRRYARALTAALAAGTAMLALAAQSPTWASLTAAGLVLAGLACFQRGRIRTLAAITAAVLVLAGLTTGIVHELRAAAEHQATNDPYRAQLRPRTPTDAIIELMRLTARGDAATACALCADQARQAFADAFQAPDCPAAIAAARARITDPTTYADTLAGLLDTIATTVSIGLRNGVPLQNYVDHLTDTGFTPNGPTDDPDIHRAASITDYLFCRLAHDFLRPESRSI